MYMDVPHNDRVYMYTLIHSITLHSIILQTDTPGTHTPMYGYEPLVVLNELMTLHRFSVHSSAVLWSCAVVNVGRHINQAWEVHVSTVVQLDHVLS